MIFLRLAPHRLRLRLDTLFSIKHDNTTIENTERALYLHPSVREAAVSAVNGYLNQAASAKDIDVSQVYAGRLIRLPDPKE